MKPENLEIIMLIKLLLAHFISDFIIQPDSWVANRKTKGLKSPYLYIHSISAGVLSYIFIGQWEWWYLLIIVFVLHLLIDMWKVKRKNTLLPDYSL